MHRTRGFIPILFTFAAVLLSFGHADASQERDFATWLRQLQQDAAARGISAVTVRTHLENLEPLADVIELDRRQLAGKNGGRITLQQYLERVVSETRIRTAREKLALHRTLLREVADFYGVEPAILVALWGIESDFGRRPGDFPVVDALATLAYEGRREKLFRGELLEILALIDAGAIPQETPRGSWAGAMGQVQFLPSSFRAYSVDFDGDGAKDIWDTPADAFASAANYLSRSGWKAGLGWGQRVQLPRGVNPKRVSSGTSRSLQQWRALGLKGVRGPDRRLATLVLPDGRGGAAYLVTGNFAVLKKWNNSTFFGIAVGHLADRIAAAK